MSFFATIFKKPKRGEDYGILQAIVSYDMLIIFLAVGVGLGSLDLDHLGPRHAHW
jgi:hypothetical protein